MKVAYCRVRVRSDNELMVFVRIAAHKNHIVAGRSYPTVGNDQAECLAIKIRHLFRVKCITANVAKARTRPIGHAAMSPFQAPWRAIAATMACLFGKY